MSKWDGYAEQKVGLAFQKLVESPDAGWAGGALQESQSDLSAVDDDDVPDDARADLATVKGATTVTVDLVRAISRLYVKVLAAREPVAS